MTTLSWDVLATIKGGAWLSLASDHYYTIGKVVHMIPAGTKCVVMENGLRQLWDGLVVTVEDERIAKHLLHAQDDHNGCMLVERDTQPLSPFILDEADINDWVGP